MDDDRDTAEMVGALLEFSDISVLIETDGSNAIATLREHDIDLVLLDLVIPGLKNGFDIREEMLADEALARIPCIVFTALPIDDEGLSKLNPAAVIDKSTFFRRGETHFLDTIRSVVHIRANTRSERSARRLISK